MCNNPRFGSSWYSVREVAKLKGAISISYRQWTRRYYVDRRFLQGDGNRSVVAAGDSNGFAYGTRTQSANNTLFIWRFRFGILGAFGCTRFDFLLTY